MKYIVLLFKNSKLEGVVTCSTGSTIKIERTISTLQTFGAEVKIEKCADSANFRAIINFFNGPVHSKKNLELVDDCGSVNWDTDLMHGMNITIIPDDLSMLHTLRKQNK